MKKIILVDDSKTVYLSANVALKQLVENKEIELVYYENPLTLLEHCKSDLIYDLLITDINMPQMTGLELAQHLKSLSSVKMKPILALTTESSDEKKGLAKEIGIAGWITKPFTADKLIMAIKRVLRM